MDTCLSTRWLGIFTSPLASMFPWADRPREHSEWRYVVILSVSYPRPGSLLHRSIPHPRGHAHLAALVSHDSKVSDLQMKISLEHTVTITATCCGVTTVNDHRGSWDDFMLSCTFVTPKIIANILLVTTLVLIGCCSLQLLTPYWPSVLWRSYSWNHQPFGRHRESLCWM